MPSLLQDIRTLLADELDTEKAAEQFLGSRIVGDLVSSGAAAWARVEQDGAKYTLLRLEDPVTRVRAGDYVRVLAAGQSAERESLHQLIARGPRGRSWDSSRQVGYRCVERTTHHLKLDRRLPRGTDSRVLVFDPEPLCEVLEVLFNAMDNILATPHIAELISTTPTPWLPEWLSFDDAARHLLRSDSAVRIVQGPPGCGKTRLIAKLALERQRRGEAVLGVAFTHRALVQIAGEFTALAEPTDTPLWYRERNPAVVPDGCRARAHLPGGDACRGATLLVTATKAALSWKQDPPRGWDVVVIDEASQLALPMTLAAIALGREAIIVGDPRQLPPVTRSDTANSQQIADGLPWLSERAAGGIGIREIRRLNEPLCAFISRHFYEGHLVTVPDARGGNRENILPLGNWSWAASIPDSAGVALVRHTGDAEAEARLVVRFLEELDHELGGASPFKQRAPLRYAVATPRRGHISRLQAVFREHSDLLSRTIIETVDRLQGETVDVCIFSTGEVSPSPAGPGRDLAWTLSARRLNVALTRARFLSAIVTTERYADTAGSRSNPDEVSRQAWRDLLEPPPSA